MSGRDLHRFVGRRDVVEVAGDDVDAGFLRQLLGFDLVAHRGDGVGRRADEGDPGLGQRLGEALALAEEAVARMHRLGAGRLAGVDDQLGLEIGFGRRRGPEPHALVGHPHMRRARVGVGINRDRLDAHAPRGADHPAGNFPAIGDQDFLEHLSVVHLRTRCKAADDECHGQSASTLPSRSFIGAASADRQCTIARHNRRAAPAASKSSATSNASA